MVEQLLREAFELCPERVICLRDRITGAVTAAKTQMAEGDYEIITDEGRQADRSGSMNAVMHFFLCCIHWLQEGRLAIEYIFCNAKAQLHRLGC